MAKLPEAPSPRALAERTAPARVAVARHTPLYRIYAAAGPHPGRWDEFRTAGPLPTGRFDHQRPSGRPRRGILYAALSIQTCVAEFFQETRVVDRARRSPWLTGFRLRRTVRVLDVTGTWPTRAGASQALSSGRRDRAQAWSRAIHEAYPDIEGLWYPSSMNGGQQALALYERAADALPEQPDLHLQLAHPALELPLARMATELGYLVI